jgi:hypothetical protein
MIRTSGQNTLMMFGCFQAKQSSHSVDARARVCTGMRLKITAYDVVARCVLSQPSHRRGRIPETHSMKCILSQRSLEVLLDTGCTLL